MSSLDGVKLPRGLEGSVILYDGDCGFCSRTVAFVADRDPGGNFRFAALQSRVGQEALRAAGLPLTELSTVVLLDRGRVFTKSAAALRIASGLQFPWPFFRVFRLVPTFIRDRLYDTVARYRHRILPKAAACLMPSQLEGRLVEDLPPE